jgi:hypothetical protein
MNEKPDYDALPVEDPPQMTTPVIQTQDLEYTPGPLTRVSNKGVKITPSLDGEEHDQAKEDEEAIHALEQLEESVKGGPYN